MPPHGSGIAPTAAAKTLPDVRISGRSETVGLPNGALGVIDYAHNGVSLRRLLTELRASCRGRLIVLFGSVGERTSCAGGSWVRLPPSLPTLPC